MPSQVLYELMNYVGLVLIALALVVGMVLTKGTVRALMIAALVAEALAFASTLTLPSVISPAGEMAIMLYSLLQNVLYAVPVILIVTGAVIGARQAAKKDAVITALTDPATETWTQPEGSPDPRLLAD